MGDLKNGALTARATLRGSPEKVATRVKDNAGSEGTSKIEIAETPKGGNGSFPVGNLENSAVAVCTTPAGRPEEIAAGVEYNAGCGRIATRRGDERNSI